MSKVELTLGARRSIQRCRSTRRFPGKIDRNSGFGYVQPAQLLACWTSAPLSPRSRTDRAVGFDSAQPTESNRSPQTDRAVSGAEPRHFVSFGRTLSENALNPQILGESGDFC
jgi:hypothetical protein